MSSYQLRMTQEAGLQAANAAGAVLTAVRGVPLAVSERIAASLPIEDLHTLGAACILPNAATDEVYTRAFSAAYISLLLSVYVAAE